MEDPRETKRLVEKVDAMHWAKEHFVCHLARNSRVLDVGCGPGVLAAAVAHHVPDGHVTGFDASAERLKYAQKLFAKLPNAKTCQGDAVALPFADGTFDFVYSRFLLEYLPQKEESVAEMARVCRAGGAVFLQDLDGQLVWHHPVDDELQTGLEKVMAALGKTGFDPFVGRKLFGLARNAGLSNIKVNAESYHLFAGKIDEHNLQLWEMKLDIALPVAAKALGGKRAGEKLKKKFLDYLCSDDTLTYSVLFSVSGQKT
jgi:SAM-dependent methyltransferase